jgi:hypothetical protein
MGNGIKYAASFDEKLLGSNCDVDVVVDLGTGENTASVAMRQILRTMPMCRISIEALEELLAVLKSAAANAPLLESRPNGAQDHQLNWSSGAASLIIIQPTGKKPRYVLRIGSFNREGELTHLSYEEVADAVEQVNALRKTVTEKVLQVTQH